MSTIGTIIVTYNNKEGLLDCIDAVLRQDGGACDILVIDNHSKDGTKNALKEHLYKKGARINERKYSPLDEYCLELDYKNTKIRYARIERYLGSAGAFERGIKIGVTLGYDYLWLLNDRTHPISNTLLELKKAHNKLNGKYGFLSSKVLCEDKKMSKRHMPMLSVNERMEDTKEDLIKIEFATFVSCFIKTSVIKKVFLPIGEFFVSGQALEYTRRITKKYKSYFVNDSIVYFNIEKNEFSDISQADEKELFKFDYGYRNKFYIYKKDGIKGVYCFLSCTKKDIKNIILNSTTNRTKRITTILKGTLKGLLYNPTIDRI